MKQLKVRIDKNNFREVNCSFQKGVGKRSTSINKHVHGVSSWALLILAFIMATGCASKNLGVSTAQMMPAPAVKKWVIDAPFESVWIAASADAEKNSDRILVSSENEGIISWCEAVENWRDLGQGSVMPKSLVGGVDPDIFLKDAQQTGKGVAVTTLWIEAVGSQCNLHVERVYYGRQSYPGVSHSCGDYEKEMYNRIRDALRQN